MLKKLDLFRGKIKLVSLLNAVGKAGRAALTYLGFDQKGAISTYDGAMELLKTVYKFGETVYVKTGYGKDRKSSTYSKDYSKDRRSSRDCSGSSRDSSRERKLA